MLHFFRRFRKDDSYPAQLHTNDTYLSELGSSRSCYKIFSIYL